MGKKTITMPVSSFVAEHENLIQVLEKGSRAKQKKEAKEQKAELAKYVGGALRSLNLDESPILRLGDELNKLILAETARKFQADRLGNAPRKTWNGRQWYLETRPQNDQYGSPPGYWLRTDLTLSDVESYNLPWEVLGEFPDGSLRHYQEPKASKWGLESVYVDDDARRDLKQAWDAWADEQKKEQWKHLPNDVRVNALQSLLDAQRKQTATLTTIPGVIGDLSRKANLDRINRLTEELNSASKNIITPYPPELLPVRTEVKGSYSFGPFSMGLGKPASERRLFPEQFSTPLRKLLEEVAFGPPDVMGSSGDHRVMYSADYDLLEFVTFHGKASVKAFQKKVASLASKHCITDIKCGEMTEWNLLQTQKYDQKKELAHLRRLWQDKVITDAELKKGEAILKEKLDAPGRVSARKELRFGILRWTPAEVAKGVKMNRLDKPVRLEDAMKSKGITKVDVLAWVKDKYVEVSNIILWTNRSGKPYAHLPEVTRSLKEDIAYYVHDGNYFKAVKRMLSVAKNRKEVAQQEALLGILNSPLGHISTVVSDLKVLAEFPKCVTDKKREELDAMRDDMAKLYYPEFFKAKDPSKLLPALEVKLQQEAKKKLEEAGFLPLKGHYKVEKE